MKRYDRIIGLIWFVMGGGMAIEGLHLGLGKSNLPGIGFVPFLVGSSLGVCGLALMVLVTLKGKTADKKIWEGQNWRNIVLPILALVLYAFLMEHLGFVITTFLFLLFLLKLTDPKRWLNPMLAAALISLCCYILFSVWLEVPLPKGFWTVG